MILSNVKLTKNLNNNIFNDIDEISMANLVKLLKLALFTFFFRTSWMVNLVKLLKSAQFTISKTSWIRHGIFTLIHIRKYCLACLLDGVIVRITFELMYIITHAKSSSLATLETTFTISLQWLFCTIDVKHVDYFQTKSENQKLTSNIANHKNNQNNFSLKPFKKGEK